MSIKRDTINVNDSLSSSGVLLFRDGYLYLNNKNNDLLENSLFGTNQGTITSKTTLNNSGPILFGPSEDDRKQQLQLLPTIIRDFPVTAKFPWLYPIVDDWSNGSQVLISSSSPTVPITKVLGKGLGVIQIYKVSEPLDGYPSKAGITINNDTYADQSPFTDKPIYPFNGFIQSGTLVEIISDNEGNPVVIPYQSGRGIPPESKNFQPSLVTQPSPWGPLEWPQGGPVRPYLSPGAQENYSVGTYGVVLDSYSSNSYETRKVRSNIPEGYLPQGANREPWYNHPAPHTIPPTSLKEVLPGQTQFTQGFLSPGPCLANNFWSPWPNYYSYKSGDPIPVLTEGITTVRVGAAYNIALTTYGFKTSITATNNVWLPVQIIPLFGGESLQAGSLVYGSVRGKIQTGGPYVPSRDVVQPSSADELLSVVQSGILGQTVWDVNSDSTWGNVGWCGTPGLGFHNLPDSGVSPMETASGVTMPYLVQALQGSVIVTGVTNVSPYPGLGNLYNPPGFSGSEVNQISRDRFKLPGVSGRGCLSQEVPEKAQPIGVIMETIEGTGKWPYTGLTVPVVDGSVDTELANGGGSNYRTGNLVGTVQVRESVITPPTYTFVVGAVTYNSSNPEYPFLSRIDGIPESVISFPLETLTVLENSLTYGFPKYKGNNASYFALTSIQRGGYYDIPGSTLFRNVIMRGYNLSVNNAYISFVSNDGTTLTRDNEIAPLLSTELYPQSFGKYQIGQYLRVLGPNVQTQNSNVFLVNNINQTTGALILQKISSGSNFYVPTNGVYTYMETEILNYNYRNPIIRITTNSGTRTITEVELLDYGVGALNGDQLLCINIVPNSNRDCISGDNANIRFGGVPLGYQQLTPACPWYFCTIEDSNQFNISRIPLPPITSLTVNNAIRLRPDVVRLLKNQEYIPAWYEQIIPITVPVSGARALFFRVFFNTNLPGGATSIAQPNYIGSSFTLEVQVTNFGSQIYSIVPCVGGTNYSNAEGLLTYNMTANTLRVPLQISGGFVSQEIVTYTITNDNYDFLRDRYVADSINGTLLSIMNDTIPSTSWAVYRLTNITGNQVTLRLVTVGSSYGLANGTYLFHTQRLDQENPIVDISVRETLYFRDPNPPNLSAVTSQVSQVRLVSRGFNNEQEDVVLILQPDSNNNAFFLFDSEPPLIDLPPFAQVPGFTVDTSEANWGKYNNAMSTATNLLDRQILVKLNKYNGDYMEKVGPSGQQATNLMPSNKNPYRNYYP